MHPNIKLHHLRDFVAIAQYSSVRGAARALGMAQPAMTRSLRELEKELQTPLVERHAKGVILTEAGNRLLVRAQGVMQEVRRAGEEIRQLGGSGAGTVSVGLSSAAMLGLLPQALAAFRAHFPLAKLRIVEGVYPTIESRLLNGQLDFFVGPSPERRDKSLSQELIFTNERVVVGRKGHPLHAANSLAQLTQVDWVLTGLREREAQEYEELFATYDLPAPKTSMRIESTLGLLSVLASTDALVLLPRQWTDSSMFKALLIAIPVQEKLLAPDIVLIYRASVPLTPVAEKLATLLQRQAGTQS